MLLPILLGGGSVQDVFRAISGFGSKGASSYDSISYAMSAQNSAFSKKNYPGPNDNNLNTGIGYAQSSLGMNPYSAEGQAVASILRGAYRLFPDVVGTLIGAPNPQSFFRNMVNGAPGINAAAGRGIPNITNPYSVMQAQEFAYNNAQMIYGMAMRPEGGFQTSFTHGMNMSEIGMMSQRLMSSNFIYEEGGKRFDDKSDKFEERVRKFGEEFNRTASMLSKITGSIDEAINLMDRMSGSGNFLGSTANDALDVAKKARRFAATVRVTSAMAGISPQEVYAQTMGLQSGIIGKYNVGAGVAMATPGFSEYAYNQASAGMMAYSMWAAQNPTASKQQKASALIGAQRRATAYANSSAEHMAAIVAANREMFSPEELERIERSFRSGSPNDYFEMVSQRIGPSAFASMMGDEGEIQAARMKAASSKEGRDLLSRFSSAGIVGNVIEAGIEGARRGYSDVMDRTDSRLEKYTGDMRSRVSSRREYATNALAAFARKRGFTDLSGKSDREIMDMLDGVVDRRELEMVTMRAGIDEQISGIEGLRMTQAQEQSAEGGFLKALGGVVDIGSEAWNSWRNRFEKAEDKNAVIEEFLSKNVSSAKDRERMREEITGGRLFGSSAEKMIKDLMGVRDKFSQTNYSSMISSLGATIGNRVTMMKGSMASVITREDYNKASTDSEALGIYDSEVKKNGISVKDYRGDAVKMLVDKVLDGGIGDVKKGDKEDKESYDKIVKTLTDSIMSSDNIKEGFIEGIKKIGDDKELVNQIGSGGKALIDEWANGEGSGLEFLNRKELGSLMTSVINYHTRDIVPNRLKSFENALKENNDGAAIKLFRSEADSLVKQGYLKGDSGEAIRMGTADVLKEILTGDEYKDVDVNKIVSGLNLNDDDIQGSIVMGLRASGKVKAASAVSRVEGFRKKVFAGAFGRLGVDSKSADTYDSARVGGSANDAALNYNAALIDGSYVDLSGVDEGDVDAIADMLSAGDDERANVRQNAIQNAARRNGRLMKESIENAKATLDRVRDAFASNGVRREDLLKYASDVNAVDGSGKSISERLSNVLKQAGVDSDSIKDNLSLVRNYIGRDDDKNIDRSKNADNLTSKNQVEFGNDEKIGNTLNAVSAENNPLVSAASGIETLAKCVDGDILKVVVMGMN